MAIIKKLDVAFSGEGANAPVLIEVDPIESDGSLLLVDMSKLSVLPNSGSSIPNLFEDKQRVITGAESSIIYTAQISDATASKIERTAKGGLHFISKPQVYAPFPVNYANIKEQGAVHDWIVSHWQNDENVHHFYFSLWYAITGKGNLARYNSNFSHNANHNFQRVYYMQEAPDVETGVKNFATKESLGFPEGETPSLPNASTPFNIFNGGNVGLNQAGYQNRQYESIIFYRFYVEDLTVSGRTWEEVNALDTQLFNKAFAVGGKFYNDTYTNPATAFTS